MRKKRDARAKQARQGPTAAEIRQLFAGDRGVDRSLNDLERHRTDIVDRAADVAGQFGEVEAYLRNLGYAAEAYVTVADHPTVLSVGFASINRDQRRHNYSIIYSIIIKFKANPPSTIETARWSNTPLPVRLAAAAYLPTLLVQLAEVANARVPRSQFDVPVGAALVDDDDAN